MFYNRQEKIYKREEKIHLYSATV